MACRVKRPNAIKRFFGARPSLECDDAPARARFTIKEADVAVRSNFLMSGSQVARRLGVTSPIVGLQGPSIISRPTTQRTGTSQLNWGGLAEDILGGIVDVGTEWVRGKLAGSGSTVPTSGNVVPGTPLVSGPAACPEGTFRIPGTNSCADLIPGGSTQGGGMVLSTGEAVMGRFGAALVPMMRTTAVARCPRGAVLGIDGLCYNKSQLRKSDRKWIPPRKPLLTGGDLNAISRASRAANRVKVQQKRLEKLGLLKKPSSRGRGGSRGVITKAEAARALRK